MDQFLVRDLTTQFPVVDGGRELGAYEFSHLLASVFAQRSFPYLAFEVAGSQGFLRRSPFQESFGEQRFKGFGQVQSQSIASPVGIGVEKADGWV